MTSAFSSKVYVGAVDEASIVGLTAQQSLQGFLVHFHGVTSDE
ncbi:hypothetical protein [Desmonostoc muscorum]|nr:hypothetical protein [Desmonostoc muscorum]